MKSAALLACFALLTLQPTQRRNVDYNLPARARLVETRAVNTKAHPNRTLLLWMLRPTVHPRETPDEIYMCPEETRGSYLSGPLRVSLFDTATRRIINTVEVKQEYSEGVEDSFDIPYKIHQGYYHVAGVRGTREGKPSIMYLRDYNGDGRALEFALFDALACMGLSTTLIGYSERQDGVIQYETELTTHQGNKRSTAVVRWVDYFFGQKPVKPGYWKYEIDYRGRGGSLDRYEIRYDLERERFQGKLVSTQE